MAVSAPSLSVESGRSTGFPSRRFNQRERQLLLSVKTYVDSLSPDTVITTQGDIIIGNASGNAARLAKGASGTVLVAGASTVAYSLLSLANLGSGIAPSHVVKLAGSGVTGTALSGLLVGDIVLGIPTSAGNSQAGTVVAPDTSPFALTGFVYVVLRAAA